MRRWCLSSSRRVSDGVACAVGTRRRHRPAAFCFSATVVSGGRHGFAVTRLYRPGRKKRGYRVDCCCAPKERGRRVRKELPSGLASGLVEVAYVLSFSPTLFRLCCEVVWLPCCACFRQRQRSDLSGTLLDRWSLPSQNGRSIRVARKYCRASSIYLRTLLNHPVSPATLFAASWASAEVNIWKLPAAECSTHRVLKTHLSM